MKYILWDHDGVLVDTEPWYFLATQASLSELGCAMDQATYLEWMAAGRGYWEEASDDIELLLRQRSVLCSLGSGVLEGRLL